MNRERMEHMLDFFKGFRKSREFGIFLILIAIVVVVSIFSGSFFSAANLMSLVKSNVVLAIMATGMLLVLLTGGIDVSAASIISAVTVVIGTFMVNVSGNILLVFLVGLATGTAMGLVNGLLIAKLKIPPIVATLGTSSIIFGLTLYFTNGNWITGIPQNFIEFGMVSVGKIPVEGRNPVGLPIQFFFFLLAAIITWYLLKHTVIGRSIYAFGGNRESAERIGLKTDNILLFVYGYEGFLIGLAGVVHTSIMRQVDPNAFIGFEIQVIASVVLGGASVLGGYGSIFGTILGVSVFTVINNGLILLKIPVFWQKIVVGLVIIISISIDIIQKNRKEKKSIRVDIEEHESERKPVVNRTASVEGK